MKQTNKDKHLSKRSGFTLIEVILVVVIIGILSGIVLKGLDFSGQAERAKIVEAGTDIATLSTALDLYEMNNGTYPESLDGLLDSSKQGFPFLRQPIVPKDPWGNNYQYVMPGAHNTHRYDISCTSAKGLVINNWGEDPEQQQ